MKKVAALFLFLIAGTIPWVCAQEESLRLEYKRVSSVQLFLRVYYPPDLDTTRSYPVIIFFFGGGWYKGSYRQFLPHAAYFAGRGIVSVLADYRVDSLHHTSPFDAVRDAKSAIRFLRQQADRLHIDPQRIVAAGGSAGGHLAAAAGNIIGLEEANEDLSVSSRPNALVLFNPVFDNGPGGYGYKQFGNRYPEISPLHNIRPGAPPTIVFLGTRDALVPVATAQLYQQKMKEAGSRCDLHLYEGQEHGFFNHQNSRYYSETVQQADQFLTSLGYLR
ncbi:alpha/beta hydrolase [Nibrella saemangeumensis]|uniref:Alpha/beta hydrolase n=1 Tax=Nibrella saemangeumensis TaxID=1084526 RepID=A0ABP8NMD1_9BACT